MKIPRRAYVAGLALGCMLGPLFGLLVHASDAEQAADAAAGLCLLPLLLRHLTSSEEVRLGS